MGKYNSELVMLFNLAFLMKCKYIFCLTSRPKVLHSHGDVTIQGEGLIDVELC